MAVNPSPSRTAPPGPPPSWRRAPVWLALLAVLLLLAAVGVVQLVLWGDTPRRMVERELHALTALNVSVGSAQTGWTGRTVLRDVTLSLPLAERPMLVVRRVVVRHQGLPSLLWSGSADVRAIDLHEVAIELQPDAQGQWNLAAAWQSGTDRATQDAGPDRAAIVLPRITLHEGTLTVLNRGGQEQLHTPLRLELLPRGQGLYQVELAMPNLLQAKGRFSPPQRWAHELDVSSPDLSGLLGPFVSSPLPSPLVVDARWRGRIDGDRLAGLFERLNLNAPQAAAQGQLAATFDQDGLILQPIELVIAPAKQPQEPLRLHGGSLRLAQGSLEARSLLLSAWQHEAQLSGHWSPQDRSVRAQATFRGRWQPVLDHNGQISAELNQSAVGPLRLTVALDTQGRTTAGAWQGRIATDVTGADWQHLLAQLQVEQFAWQQDEQVINLDGASTQWQLDGSVLRWRELSLPQAQSVQLTASQIDLASGQWNLDTAVRRWQPLGLAHPADLRLEARGMGRSVEQFDVDVRTAGWRLESQGSYDPARDNPLTLKARTRFPSEPPYQAHNWTLASLSTHWDVQGSLHPLRLAAQGEASVVQPTFEGRRLPDLTVPWQGTVTERQAVLQTQAMAWLGARWTLRAEHDLRAGRTRLAGDVTDLDLGRCLEAAGVDTAGVVAGTLQAQMQASMEDLSSMPEVVQGQWQVRDLQARGVRGERGGGAFVLRGRDLSLENLELSRGKGRFTGSARAQLNRDPRATVVGSLQQFDLEWPQQDLRLVLDGKTNLTVQVRSGASNGDIDGRVALHWRQQPVGELELQGQMQEHDLIVQKVRGQLLGGQLEGAGRLALNQPLNSSADLNWSNVDALQLRALLGLSPNLDIAGKLTGTLTMAPSQQPRALEPLQAQVHLEPGLVLRGSPLGSVDLTSFIGSRRVVIDRSRIHLLGGEAELWLQWVRRSGENSLQVQLKAEALDLAQVAQMGGAMASPPVGRMWIDGMAAGLVGRPESAFGQATLRVDQSDLIGLPPMAALYNALNLGRDGITPTGSGSAGLRLTGGGLRLENIRYFNRGTEVLGEAQVKDIWNPQGRQLDGVAVAAARPFKDLGVPGAKTLDQLFRALQGNTAAVRIQGDLGQGMDSITTTSVPLSDLGDMLNRLLLHQR